MRTPLVETLRLTMLNRPQISTFQMQSLVNSCLSFCSISLPPAIEWPLMSKRFSGQKRLFSGWSPNSNGLFEMESEVLCVHLDCSTSNLVTTPRLPLRTCRLFGFQGNAAKGQWRCLLGLRVCARRARKNKGQTGRKENDQPHRFSTAIPFVPQFGVFLFPATDRLQPSALIIPDHFTYWLCTWLCSSFFQFFWR